MKKFAVVFAYILGLMATPSIAQIHELNFTCRHSSAPLTSPIFHFSRFTNGSPESRSRVESLRINVEVPNLHQSGSALVILGESSYETGFEFLRMALSYELEIYNLLGQPTGFVRILPQTDTASSIEINLPTGNANTGYSLPEYICQQD